MAGCLQCSQEPMDTKEHGQAGKLAFDHDLGQGLSYGFQVFFRRQVHLALSRISSSILIADPDLPRKISSYDRSATSLEAWKKIVSYIRPYCEVGFSPEDDGCVPESVLYAVVTYWTHAFSRLVWNVWMQDPCYASIRLIHTRKIQAKSIE